MVVVVVAVAVVVVVVAVVVVSVVVVVVVALPFPQDWSIKVCKRHEWVSPTFWSCLNKNALAEFAVTCNYVII